MDTPEDLSPEAYSITNFCRTFDVGRSLIYKEIAAGRLKIRKVGRRTIILHHDAVAWVEALPAG